MGIRQALNENFEHLSPQLKTAATYVSRHPESVINLSLRKVAEKSGVSAPTFSRLAKALGLNGGYDEIRQLCRQSLTAQHQTFAEKVRALQQYEQGDLPRNKGTFAVVQAAAAIDNIQDMVDRLEPDKLSAAADLLAAAPTVYIAGGLASRAFADYFAYMSAMAFSHWSVLDIDREPVGVSVQRLKADDALIVIAMRPFSRKIVQLADLAAQKGVRLIVLTDFDLASVAKQATYVFNTATESPQFFPSYAAPLVLLESLIAMVVRRGGEDLQARIEQAEALNHQMGEYDEAS
ncbi:MAG: MurR/RpiR family transcriptional regulator [Thiolinea sp.]